MGSFIVVSPVVAPRDHREVHPLAPLEGSDEEGAGGAGDHRPVARVAGGEAPGLAGGLHPAELVGHHVEVAHHEAHDLHQLRRHPQALEAGKQVARLGRCRQQQAAEDTEGRLGDERNLTPLSYALPRMKYLNQRFPGIVDMPEVGFIHCSPQTVEPGKDRYTFY